MSATNPVSNSGDVSDVALVAAMRTGDPSSLALLYDEYSQRIYTYSVSFCRDPHRAQDITQETLILGFERIGQLRDPSKLRPWLYAICRNLCLRQAEHSKRIVPIGESFDQLERADQATDFNDDLDATDARELVSEAIAGMSDQDGEILELAIRHDLDAGQIGSVLGISPSNARARLARCRKSLEAAVGALLLFKAKGSTCEQLDQIRSSVTEFTPLVRKRIARHSQDCPTCRGSRNKAIAAVAIATLPMLAVPSGLRVLGPQGSSVEVARGLGTESEHAEPIDSSLETQSGTTPDVSATLSEHGARGSSPTSTTGAHLPASTGPPVQFDRTGWPVNASGRSRSAIAAAVAGTAAAVLAVVAALGVAESDKHLTSQDDVQQFVMIEDEQVAADPKSAPTPSDAGRGGNREPTAAVRQPTPVASESSTAAAERSKSKKGRPVSSATLENNATSPTSAAKPSSKPDQAPTAKPEPTPSGKPTDGASGKPKDSPTEKPSDPKPKVSPAPKPKATATPKSSD